MYAHSMSYSIENLLRILCARRAQSTAVINSDPPESGHTRARAVVIFTVLSREKNSGFRAIASTTSTAVVVTGERHTGHEFETTSQEVMHVS